MSGRRRMVSVIGPSDVGPDDHRYGIAYLIGKLLVDNGFRVMTGGLSGIMEAALKGARESASYREGDTIGVIPSLDPDDANPYCDIVIPTGLGIGRNLIVSSADGIIAVGGGSGTLSEIALSWQKGRPIAALDVPGWSGELADRALDDRRNGYVMGGASSPEEAVAHIMSHLDEGQC